MANEDWVVVRMKVQDKNRFIADMRQMGYATAGFGRETQRLGGIFQAGTHHGFLWNQMLFTARRTLYHLTQAVGLVAAGVVGFGFKYNIMIEQQTLAFTKFLGSAAAARKEVTWLFNLAAKGPFNFESVVKAARQLQAFGYSIDRTNKLLFSLQDAMAAMGLDQSQIERATLALGQINTSGRLLGQEARQLNQLGLINWPFFLNKLHLPQSAVAHIGNYNIDSKTAIDTIMAYWKFKYHDAAKDFQKTWTGQWSTLHDFTQKLFGTMSQPLFKWTEKHAFPWLTMISQGMSQGMETGGTKGALGFFDQKAGTNTVQIFKALVFVGTQVLSIIRDLGRDFIWAARQMNFGTDALLLVGALLWAIAHAIHFLNPVLKYLIALWVVDRTVVILLSLAYKVNAFWLAVVTAGQKRAVFWTRALTAAQLGLRLAAAETAATFAIMWFTNPVGIILGVVLLLTAGLVILYFKWKWFHRLVNDTFHLLLSDSPWVAVALYTIVGPIIAFIDAIRLAIHYWDKFKEAVKKVLPHDVSVGGSNFWSALITPIGHAAGGFFPKSHWAWVGERGPELMHVPAGSRILSHERSLAAMGGAGGGSGGRILRIEVPVFIGRKEIAHANAEISLDTLARA